MENWHDPYREKDLQHIQIFFYLIPVFGFFPSLWTLYRRQGSQEQQRASRLAVTLALGWFLSYSLLAVSTTSPSEVLTLRLLYLNGLLTSGYFLICFGLMVRLWKHKSLHLPGVSSVAQGIVRKYLS